MPDGWIDHSIIFVAFPLFPTVGPLFSRDDLEDLDQDSKGSFVRNNWMRLDMIMF